MTITFERRKKDILGKNDKSSIGEWDERIKDLCVKINKSRDYYTLSSCSGRIVLIKNIDKKENNMFLFRTHEKIKLEELKREIEKSKKYNGSVMFKQEPMIMHVACRNMICADKLMKKSQESGFKHSGIISLAENRVIVEIKGDEILSFPIIENGKLIADENFLRIIVKESNIRLEKTWKKIEILKKGFFINPVLS